MVDDIRYIVIFVGILIILILLFREYLIMNDKLKYLDDKFEDDLDRILKKRLSKNNDTYFKKRSKV
jgi:hypothetical protein